MFAVSEIFFYILPNSF